MTANETLQERLREASENPVDEARWDAAEAEARDLQRPEEVEALYLDVLTRPLPVEALRSLGLRAVAFHDEWSADSDSLVLLLERAFAADASATWAFERLTMLLTVSERWNDLLSLYDRAIDRVSEDDRERRAALLDEAAHVAKDFADQPERSIRYLEGLFALDLGNVQVARALERLYERHARHRDLIALWAARVPFLSPDAAMASRVRIAQTWLDPLHDDGEALAATEDLLSHGGDEPTALGLLERVAASASSDVARRAIAILRARFDAAGRGDDVLRVLTMALRVAGDDAERARVHADLAARLLAAGRDREATAHYAELVALDPGDPEHLSQLTDLAERTGLHASLADALARGADAIARSPGGDPALRLDLLVRAGTVRADVLEDPSGAAVHFSQVLASPEAPAEVALPVARRLATLLEAEGRDEPRLDVLERLASLEPDRASRRAVLGTAARLAERLGDTDRALASWHARLRETPGDAESLDALVALLTSAERWEPLINALHARAAAAVDDAARRADLVRVAETYARRLGRVDEAVAAWADVRREFGEDAQVVDALWGLLGSAGRTDELLELLSRAAASEVDQARRAVLYQRAGDVLRAKGDLSTALGYYRAALDDSPSEPGARAGLCALLEDATASSEVGAAAVQVLARAYHATDDWELTLGLVEHRLTATADRPSRAAVLMEAAALQETRACNVRAALSSVGRALPLSVDDDASLQSVERELHRLAGEASDWQPAVLAYQAAVRAAADDRVRASRMSFQLGSVLEARMSDQSAALDAFERVAAESAGDLNAALAVVRVGGRVGRWDSVARVFVASAKARNSVAALLVTGVEAAARASSDPASSWNALTALLEEAYAEAGLQSALARALEAQLGVWHRDRRDDRDAAVAALLRAVAHDASEPETLRMLADLQRARPDRTLVETLRTLATAEPDESLALDALREAAEVALESLDDDALARTILSQLLERAAGRWQSLVGDDDADPDALATASDHSAWAVRALVDLYVARGDHARAVEMLVSASRLPFAADASRALRHEAAERAALHLRDEAAATELYEGILAEAPADLRAVGRLAELYRAAGRHSDLLALRAHELELTSDVPRRLELRLEMAAIYKALGDVEGRTRALEANLVERPGHGASIEALAEVLEASHRTAELVQMLTGQAALLEAAGDADGAAPRLWSRAATLAETQLGDVARAIAAHERVVAREADANSLDALARMHSSRGEHDAAVRYLERRLEGATGEARRATVAGIARAHVATGNPERATAALERLLMVDPSAREARTLLADLYRKAGAWEPLADLLTAPEVEAADQLASLREAADVMTRRLAAPERAVPVLERAAALAPEDRGVRTALADAMREAGQFDAARAILDALVEGFGRHRPPERAQVHFQLARIAQARGDLPGALQQLELASSIDMAHPGIFKLLGDLSRDAGHLDRAERAYRALLMIVRRITGPAAQSPDAIGPSEVLLALHDIARRLGQAERAQETLESAYETAARSELEARRFERALRSSGHPDLLLRALDARLVSERDPARISELQADRAAALGTLGRREEALEAHLAALSFAPEVGARHDAVRALARDVHRPARYVDALASMAARVRDAGGPAGALYLRLGAALEEDLADSTRAAAAYAEAEAVLDGDDLLTALRALDRLCATNRDAAGQARVLRRLIDADPDAAVDAAKRLSAIQLAQPDAATRDEGVAWVAWVLEHDADAAAALSALRDTLAAHPDHEAALDLYLRVAREGGEAPVVLDAIARRVSLADATTELLREGVELAAALDDNTRVEALLRRAVSLGEARGEASEAVWALVALAERSKSDGDLHAAVRWLQRAADAAEPDEAHQFGLEVASLAAGPLGDLALAAATYERLRQRDPADRAVWEPLLDVYRMLGDHDALARLIDQTVEHVFDQGARTRLRIERARIVLADPARAEEAVAALRGVLDEDPDDATATTLLADLYERLGRAEDLAALLARQFDHARDAGDEATTAALGLRLATLLAPTRRGDALDALRSAIDVATTSKELLRALLDLLTPDDDAGERAAFTERLVALETGPEAARLALDLARLREELGDDEGVERALEAGFRATPDDTAIRDRLVARYEARHDWASLASLRETVAVRAPDAATRAAGLRAAAAIHRDQLGQHDAATALLQRARKDLPHDAELLDECVQSLMVLGRHAEAVSEVSAALDAGGSAVELLRLRAVVRSQGGDETGAIEDLESARSHGGGTAVAVELSAALDRARLDASRAGDADTERSLTMRLIDVLPSAGSPERADSLLAEWAERNPGDAESSRRLAARHAEAGRWEAAAQMYERLVSLLEGDARSDAALKLADACERAGRPDDAATGLADAYASDRSNGALRERLRTLHSARGACREVAALWLDEADLTADDNARFEALRKAGEAWLEAGGDPAQAVAALERAIALRPLDNDVTSLLADGYTMTERLEDASRVLEEAIASHKGKRSKELAILQQRMAHVAYAAGDHNIEMAWLNAALDTDMQNGQIAAELADASMELGNHEIALKALRAVTLMKNPSPMSRAQAFLKQGVIASTQGDNKKAVFLARKALSEDPALEDAQRFLAQITAE